jgi:ferrous iron transport protein B
MAAFALAGNPNVGKTAVFNALTGLAHATGNYPGTTVDRKHGFLRHGGEKIEIIDLPGSYSLAARSPDEIIVADILLDQQQGEASVGGLIAVLDASNLERNLYFLSQLLDVGKPTVVALNMMDIAERRGIQIDCKKLSVAVGVPVVPLCARTGLGMDKLRDEILRLAQGKIPPPPRLRRFPEAQEQAAAVLCNALHAHAAALGREIPALESLRLLVDEGGYAEQRLTRKLGAEFRKQLQDIRAGARRNGAPLAADEAKHRYEWVRTVMQQAVSYPAGRVKTRSERIDNILTHRVFGTFIFIALMVLIFQAIYAWAVPFMDAIEASMAAFGNFVGNLLPEGMLQSFVVDGVVAGVGSVLVFLPQILLLSLFIALLEDFGYMARAAFLMDKLLGWCGLSGQSFIPMLSSFACAIPGIMATRTIQNRRDRFTTILVAPLMSCSARLPVYLIMIGAFVPARELLGGFLGLQGLVLFLMYCLGVTVAVPVAWVLKKTLLRGEKPPFILELPSYKIPYGRTVLAKMYSEGREFVVRAGTLIFAVTIIVWALAYFPRAERIGQTFEAKREAIEAAAMPEDARAEALSQIADEEEGAYLRDSYLGRMGHAVEPAFRPLGWDWRIATAVIASFPAREIIVATLGTLFNMGSDEDETSAGLRSTLAMATRDDGTRLFNLPVALSIMVFFALCCQCGATLATIKRETGQWRWPIITFSYMTTLAYVAAFLTYQIAMRVGAYGA